LLLWLTLPSVFSFSPRLRRFIFFFSPRLYDPSITLLILGLSPFLSSTSSIFILIVLPTTFRKLSFVLSSLEAPQRETGFAHRPPSRVASLPPSPFPDPPLSPRFVVRLFFSSLALLVKESVIGLFIVSVFFDHFGFSSLLHPTAFSIYFSFFRQPPLRFLLLLSPYPPPPPNNRYIYLFAHFFSPSFPSRRPRVSFLSILTPAF